MAEHTPGPWRLSVKVTQDGDGGTTDIGVFGPRPADIPIYQSRWSGEPPARIEANARLIAAAPELLAALKDIYASLAAMSLRPGDAADQLSLKAITVIAKATGGTP